MKYKARLTELTIKQLGKYVLANPKKYLDDPKYIMDWTLFEINGKEKQPLEFNSELDIFIAIINAGFLPSQVKKQIVNIKTTHGFEKNIEAIKYYLQKSPNTLKVLQNALNGKKNAEKLTIANDIAGKNTSSKDVYNIAQKVKDPNKPLDKE